MELNNACKDRILFAILSLCCKKTSGNLLEAVRTNRQPEKRRPGIRLKTRIITKVCMTNMKNRTIRLKKPRLSNESNKRQNRIKEKKSGRTLFIECAPRSIMGALEFSKKRLYLQQKERKL